MTLCGICESVITTRKPSVFCSGSCKKQYHISCIYSGPADLSTVLKSCTGLLWKCKECTGTEPDNGELIQVIEQKITTCFDKFTTRFMKDFEQIRNELVQGIACSTVPAVADHPVKYSDIVKNKTNPGVIIKPKREQHNSDTRSELFQQMNPVETGVQFTKVKNIKDGGILIGCKTRDDNEKLKKLAVEKLSSNYEVKEVRGINPRVRVVGISAEIKEEDFIHIITKMNSNLISSDCKLIKYFPTKKNRNIYQAIIQLDTNSYENVMHAGNLFVGYSSCIVFDAVDIYRCYRCNEFNHLAKFCNKPHTCPRCAGNHELNVCQSKILKCINCVALKSQSKSDVSADHAAWDVSKCIAYSNARDKLREDLLLVHQ